MTLGIMTFGIMTFGIMTFGIMTFGIMTFGIMTFGIMPTAYDIKHNDPQHKGLICDAQHIRHPEL